MSGAVLGVLIAHTAYELGVVSLLHLGAYVLIVMAVIGAVAGASRVRIALWIAAASAAISLLVIGHTPLAEYLLQEVSLRSDAAHSPAVVILAATAYKHGGLGGEAQARVVAGFTAIRDGLAPVLVITQPAGKEAQPYVSAIRGEMRQLGVDCPLVVLGEVDDTHDEALEVAALAANRHWSRVIIVSQPWHLRRAAGVFRTAGVHVLTLPCPEPDFDLFEPVTPGGRYMAFRTWLHEAVGFHYYKLRGWIK